MPVILLRPPRRRQCDLRLQNTFSQGQPFDKLAALPSPVAIFPDPESNALDVSEGW